MKKKKCAKTYSQSLFFFWGINQWTWLEACGPKPKSSGIAPSLEALVGTWQVVIAGDRENQYHRFVPPNSAASLVFLHFRFHFLRKTKGSTQQALLLPFPSLHTTFAAP